MLNTAISARKILTVLGLALAGAALAMAQQAAPPAGGAAAGATRTAGQQYKNLKVLQDVPAAQFIPSMRFISTALGVECEFCHNGNRAEDTDNKNTARQMMTMMFAINKANFNGRLQVTCYTCHNGRNNPTAAPAPTGQYSKAGTIVFYQPTTPPGGGMDEPMSEAYKANEAKTKAAVAAMTPTADQILAKYVEALGGEQALRKVTSRTIISTAEMSPNVRGAGPTLYVKEEQDYKAPNMYVATVGQTAKGFDGTDSWTKNANGVVATGNGKALTRAKRSADLYEPLDLKQEYPRLVVRGSDKVEGHDVWVVIGTPDGDNPERLYFDKESGLLLRKVFFDQTGVGNYNTQIDYSDYRDVNGVKVPFLVSTVSISPADTAVLHVEKVDDSTAVDASKFTKPASAPPPQRPAGQ